MSTKNSSRFTPVIIAVSVVVGILIGTFYAKHFAGNRLGIINGSSNKLNALLRIVDDQYVDTVNMADLVEKAMPQILAELDPHSTYIPAQNLEEVNSELEGSFSGIGIQFTIQNVLSISQRYSFRCITVNACWYWGVLDSAARLMPFASSSPLQVPISSSSINNL